MEKYMGVKGLENRELNNPPFGNNKGSRNGKRFVGEREKAIESSKMRKITCGRCGKLTSGHNKRTCKVNLQEEEFNDDDDDYNDEDEHEETDGSNDDVDEYVVEESSA
ncbi:hypothetical protein QVD17_30907 [Tagetes erecta]|uniref:Uncharacterized protein n=1 Tax=Tagetes erecta TaxID=13708 RepID=A0AAD8K8S4_TARER|nr:hypothetical protein QVD17_30907 [Tagetes erecta]